MPDFKSGRSGTIADAIDSLSNPTECVRAVFSNMATIHQEHGSAHVRIGLTDPGKPPHYRIDTDFASNDPEVKGERFYRAFNGKSHKGLASGSKELKDVNWSKESMSFAEVQQLLGKLRGFSRKGQNK